MRSGIILGVAAIGLSACTSTVTVWSVPRVELEATVGKMKLPGIPFQRSGRMAVAVLQCEQGLIEAVRTLELLAPEPRPPQAAKVLRTDADRVLLASAERPALMRLRDDMARHDPWTQSADALNARFEQLVQRAGAMPAAYALAGRVVEFRPYVDTGRVYFLNAPLPWFGNATLNAELADGVLSTVEAGATTGLKEGVDAISGLPGLASTGAVDQAKSSGAATPSTQASALSGNATVFRTSLRLRDLVHVYRFEQPMSTGVATPFHGVDCSDVEGLKTKHSFSQKWIEPAGERAAAPAAAKNAIQINGSITLPDPGVR